MADSEFSKHPALIVLETAFDGLGVQVDRVIGDRDDLLAACKLALTRLNDGTEVSATIAKHVEAAIAKAEGRQS